MAAVHCESHVKQGTIHCFKNTVLCNC